MTPGSLWLCALEAIDAGEAAAGPTCGGSGRAPRAPDSTRCVRRSRRRPARSNAGPTPCRWQGFNWGSSHLVVESLRGDRGASRIARELGRLPPADIRCAEAPRRASVSLAVPGPAEGSRGGNQPASQRPLSDRDAAVAMADGTRTDIAAPPRHTRLRGHGRRGRPRLGWGSLTPTELQVAEAVANGLTNRRIV